MTWNTDTPPKDRPIVAVGKIMVSDEFSTAALPFCTAIEWLTEGGHSDWYFYLRSSESPMTVRRSLDEEVIIHVWTDYPQPGSQLESAA